MRLPILEIQKKIIIYLRYHNIVYNMVNGWREDIETLDVCGKSKHITSYRAEYIVDKEYIIELVYAFLTFKIYEFWGKVCG